MFKIHLVHRSKIGEVWPLVLPTLEIYRKKSPHLVPTNEEVWQDWHDQGGDRLVVVSGSDGYAGFLTFRVQTVENERWGTLGMICMTEAAQRGGVLDTIGPQMEEMLRSFRCSIMNYMTARKGFARLAPKLGFKSRIVEWMKPL